MATVCVDASINRLHNIQKLLMAIYIYIHIYRHAGKEGGRGGGTLSLSRVQGGEKTRGVATNKVISRHK